MIQNIHLNRLLILLFLALLAMVRLFARTSGFSLLPDPYYYVYEHSINAVIAYGHLEVLRNVFDNFASSPGTIILSCFLSLVTGMDVLSISFMEGLMANLLSFLFVLLWLRSLYDNFDYAVGVVSSFSAGFTAIFYPILTYSSDAYLVLLLVLSLLASEAFKVGPLRAEFIVVLTILTVSMVMKYLPMGIYMLTVMLLLLLFLAILRVDLGRIKLITLISFAIVSIYFMYMGLFFFRDFNAFIHTIIENIEFERLQYTQRAVAARVQYDLVYSILYLLSLLKFTLVSIILIHPILTFFMRRKTEVTYRVLTFNLLGSLLYIVGVVIYVLMIAISDYGNRIISLSYAFYCTTIYSVLLYIKYGKGNRSRLFIILRAGVILFATLSALGSILTPIAQAYYEVRGLDWSTQYNYGQEGLWTSTFINEMLDRPSLNRITGTYRYIYLFSRYGITYAILNARTNISSIMNGDSLLVIPMGITKKPDASFGPISHEDFLRLVFSRNIVLSTGLSAIFK